MPRQARISVPGLFHHVMARGIEGREIFRDESDRENFLARLSDVLSAADAPRLYAWALLSNHFHLLIQPFASDLSTMMRRLLTGHGMCGEGDFFDRAWKESGASLTALGKMTGRTHVAVIKAIRQRAAG